MRPGRLRLGELIALAGAICLIVALALPWYENAQGKLSAWATFGPAVALLILAAAGALALALATVTERASTAFPVAAAVWSTLFGALAVVAAVVRLLERPDHATELCAGSWLALVGAVAVLAGSWQSMRDERTDLYDPADVEPHHLGGPE